jgi:selenium metabolism protein YedF
MPITIDARGLPCPQPVVKTKKALEENNGSVDVIVDNQTAADNVVRFAHNMNYSTVIRKQGYDFTVTIIPPGEKKTISEGFSRDITGARTGPVVVVIASETIGRGNDQLGRILMKAFLNILREQDRKPDHIVFMNSGVKLTVEQSENLAEVKGLERTGIRILVCGTCLDFFHLKDMVRAGTVSNFFEIAQLLMTADKVIQL